MPDPSPALEVRRFGSADAIGLAAPIWPIRLYLSSGWRKLGVLRPGTQVMGRPAGD